MPKNSPTPTDTTTPATAAHRGTAVGIVGKANRAASEIKYPISNPSIPPASVSDAASLETTRQLALAMGALR